MKRILKLYQTYKAAKKAFNKDRRQYIAPYQPVAKTNVSDLTITLDNSPPSITMYKSLDNVSTLKGYEWDVVYVEEYVDEDTYLQVVAPNIKRQ